MPTIYKVVLTNLSLPSKSDPKKSIAEVIIDGSYSKQDLELINNDTAFPSNNYNRLKLPEGQYSSADAMMQFVRTIGPFLSDQALYKLAHSFAEIETHGNNQSAYRTSTLAKCFSVYELERHSEHVTKENPVPAVFLSHMQTYVLPLCQHNWPTSLQDNVNKFGSFNFKNDLMDTSAKQRFKEVGCDVDFNGNVTSLETAMLLKAQVEQNYSFYPLVESFKQQDLKVDELSQKPEKDFSTFPILLQELENAYKLQKKAEVTKVSELPLTKSMKDMTGPASQSAPVKSLTKKTSSFSLMSPSTWFGSSNKEEKEKKTTTPPTIVKKPTLQRNATFSLSPENTSKIRQSFSPDTQSTIKKETTTDKRRMRYTQSFMAPPVQIPDNPERTIEVVQKELDHAKQRLAHYTKVQTKTAKEISLSDNELPSKELSATLTHSVERKQYYKEKIAEYTKEIEQLKKVTKLVV